MFIAKSQWLFWGFWILSTTLWGQGGGILTGLDFFEGRIIYDVKFEAFGSASYLPQDNPVNRMSLTIKDGDYIVQLYEQRTKSEQPNIPAGLENYVHPEKFKDLVPKARPSTFLFIADSNREYRIDIKNKRAFKADQINRKIRKRPTAVPIGDSIKVMNIMCYGYKVVEPNKETIYYINPKYKVNLKYYKDKNRANAMFLTNGLNGCIPLKIIKKTKDLHITNTCINIGIAKFDKKEFRIPQGFEILPYDYIR